MDTYLEKLQGQQLDIDNLTIECVGGKIDVFLLVRCMTERYQICCSNASSFRMNGLSFPATIDGFEVIDNLHRGWQTNVRYKVHDFEEDMICFYCEEVEINRNEDVLCNPN